MADEQLQLCYCVLILIPFQFFSRWFFMRRSGGSWLWTAVPGSHSFSMPSRIKNMSTWWGCRFFLWSWGWKKITILHTYVLNRRISRLNTFKEYFDFGCLHENVYMQSSLKKHIIFLIHSIAAAPLFECSVLVPVSLIPPPPTKSALIGQLSWAWAETVASVYQLCACLCGLNILIHSQCLRGTSTNVNCFNCRFLCCLKDLESSTSPAIARSLMIWFNIVVAY